MTAAVWILVILVAVITACAIDLVGHAASISDTLDRERAARIRIEAELDALTGDPAPQRRDGGI